MPDNGDLQFRAGIDLSTTPSSEEWRNGNRGVQCFLWLSDRNLTRSLKSAGTKALRPQPAPPPQPRPPPARAG